MVHRKLALAIGLIIAASPVTAAQPDPAPAPTAPEGSADTRYCLRLEPFTGSRVETVRCWTRDEWAEQGVDVDKEWPKEGVKVL